MYMFNVCPIPVTLVSPRFVIGFYEILGMRVPVLRTLYTAYMRTHVRREYVMVPGITPPYMYIQLWIQVGCMDLVTYQPKPKSPSVH